MCERMQLGGGVIKKRRAGGWEAPSGAVLEYPGGNVKKNGSRFVLGWVGGCHKKPPNTHNARGEL